MSALWLALPAFAAAVSAVLVILLRAPLRRYALSRPNTRSSHTAPTPQGAGIAVVAATILSLSMAHVFGAGALAWSTPDTHVGLLLGAVLALAAIGLFDDVSPLSPWVRIGVQTVACMGLLAALPHGARAVPALPYGVELVVLLIGLVWFVNLTNFMDGIDGMTVAGIVPALAGIAILTSSGTGPVTFDAAIALALAGSLLGFAPFNRHVATIFLGDVGSLAIGGITGWLLVSLGCGGQIVAAIILPLYYLADATVTLIHRLLRGARVWEAHREHFYQQAIIRGLPVPQVVARVWALNAMLLMLALTAAGSPQLSLQLACLAAGILLTAGFLHHFRA